MAHAATQIGLQASEYTAPEENLNQTMKVLQNHTYAWPSARVMMDTNSELQTDHQYLGLQPVLENYQHSAHSVFRKVPDFSS